MDVVPGSPLERFLTQIKGPPAAGCTLNGSRMLSDPECASPQDRARVLESMSEFAEIHAKASVSGQSAVPAEDDETQHYTCFVSVPEVMRQKTPTGRLRVIELNGGRKGPVDRGECTNLLRDVARYVREHYLPNTSDARFSVLALAPPE